MMPEQAPSSSNQPTDGRAFPWRCPECGKKDVRPATVAHTSRIKHDGRMYVVEVPELRVPRCGNCGELVFDNDADKQITAAFRRQLGLLLAEQIRENRVQLGLSQRELADHLGVAVKTISRWENGALTQTRAMDRYLRLYFGVPAVRAALVSGASLPSLGVQVQA